MAPALSNLRSLIGSKTHVTLRSLDQLDIKQPPSAGALLQRCDSGQLRLSDYICSIFLYLLNCLFIASLSHYGLCGFSESSAKLPEESTGTNPGSYLFKLKTNNDIVSITSFPLQTKMSQHQTQ